MGDQTQRRFCPHCDATTTQCPSIYDFQDSLLAALVAITVLTCFLALPITLPVLLIALWHQRCTKYYRCANCQHKLPMGG